METSLSLVESTDYATYDRILKDINKFSKQATLTPKDVEYVTYDNVINLTRSHSADLDGYVTTEVSFVLFYLSSFVILFVFRCYAAIKRSLHYPILTSHK